MREQRDKPRWWARLWGWWHDVPEDGASALEIIKKRIRYRHVPKLLP